MYYALCLSYHSITEAVLSASLLSGWTTTTGRLLGAWPQVGNSIKCLSYVHSDALPHRESTQSFTTFRLLAQRFTNWVTPSHSGQFAHGNQKAISIWLDS